MNFNQKVWQLLARIPRGKVTTYKIIADRLGTKAYRAVGNACKRNPDAPKVPCHRVIKSNGKIGDYSGKGGVKTKIILLQKEGISIKNNIVQNYEKVLYKF